MNYALVTGGSRGIGSAICIKLAEMGFAILLNYKSNDEEANNTKQKIEALGVPCELLKFDVSNPEETTAVLTNWLDNNKTARKTAKIEVLVNNAGIRQDNLIVFMPE